MTRMLRINMFEVGVIGAGKIGSGIVKGLVENLINERFGIFLEENPGEAKKISLKANSSKSSKFN